MAQISQLIEQAWKHLASKNIPEVARAAWFGNIMQESTWNLHADNNTHRANGIKNIVGHIFLTSLKATKTI